MKTKHWESPLAGAEVTAEIDDDQTAQISIDGQWFQPGDLRWLANKLNKLAKKLDAQVGI